MIQLHSSDIYTLRNQQYSQRKGLENQPRCPSAGEYIQIWVNIEQQRRAHTLSFLGNWMEDDSVE